MTQWTRKAVIRLGAAGVFLLFLLVIPSMASADSPWDLEFEGEDGISVGPAESADIDLDGAENDFAASAENPSSLVQEQSSIGSKGTTPIAESSSAQVDVVRTSRDCTQELAWIGSTSIRLNEGVQKAKAPSGTNTAVPTATNRPLLATNCSRAQPKMTDGGIANISWKVRIQVLSDDGAPLPGSVVRVIDAYGNVAAIVQTDEHGLTPALSLAQVRIGMSGPRVLSPYKVVVETGGVVKEFEMTVDSDRFVTFVIELPNGGQLLLGTGDIAIAIALLAMSTAAPIYIERGRIASLIPLLPLYSKVRRQDIAGQHTRAIILQHVESNPGDNFGKIRKALSLSNGNAMYHLRVLEKEGLIKSRLEGGLRKFYPRLAVLPPVSRPAQLET